ncbi:MAG: tetratricopeptide repeat protein [Akkermansiaceae bacterium]
MSVDSSARDQAFERGNTHLALGELEQAEAAYRESVELDDDFFDGWQALAMSLLKLKKIKEAIGCGIKATILEPNDLLSWTGLSQMYVQDGQIAEAEAAKANARILSMGGKVTNLGKSQS